MAVKHDLGVVPASIGHAQLALFFVAYAEHDALGFEKGGVSQLTAANLLPDDDPLGRVDAVHLEYVLGNIETNRGRSRLSEILK